MKLVVGLGNPGPQYSYNRHNVGFLAVDEIAAEYNFPDFKTKKSCLCSEGEIANEKIVLLKPLVFMNNSGQAVGDFARFYKIPLEHIYVLHDDLDVPFGKVKIKQGGGHGGHNGLKSLDALVGNSYWRVRLGISHPGHKDLVTSYVLSDFSKIERNQLALILGAVAEHLPVLLMQNSERFQSNIAQQLQQDLG